MRRLTLLASAVALGVIASGSAVSQSSSPPLGRDARRIGQQPQSEPKKQPRLDVHGDPLPEGAVARFGTTRLRHAPTKSDGWVVRAISPDGKILATANWHEARFWSLEDGKLLREFPIEGPASPIAITPDGKGFVACRLNQKKMDFYDVATGRRLRSIPYPSPHEGASAAISADCRMIASTLDEETVQVLDAESGKERIRLRGRNLRGTGLTFARDGKSLVTLGTRICRWDLSTGRELSDVTIDLQSKFVGMLQNPRGMRLSFDGKSLAVVPLRDPVRIYDTETGKVRVVLEGDKAVCCGQAAFAFSPDDRVLLTYYWDNDHQHPAVVSFWDARTGKLLRRFDDPCRSASPWTIQAEFSPDGKLVMASSWMGNDPAVRFWDPLTGRRVLHVDGHETAVTSLTFSSDGRQLISSSVLENSIRTWDIRSHRQLGIVQGPSRWSVFSPVNDKTVATANQDGGQVRDLATGKEGLRFPFDKLTNQPANYGWAKWVAVSPDEKTAVIFGSAGSEQVLPGKHRSLTRIYGWDLTSGRLLFKRDQPEPEGPRISPDTRVLARFLHTRIPVGDPEDPSFLLTTRLLLEETSTGRQLGFIPLPNYHQTDRFAYSADGQLMATISYQLKNEKEPRGGVHKRAIHIWETASGQECLRIALSETSAVPTAITFSPDGRFLVVNQYEQTLRVFDLATGKEQEGLRIPLVKWPPGSNVPAMPPMTFSPDGRWMAVCQRDHVLSIFDLARGKETGHYAGHPSEAQCLSFSPDSKFLATGHSDATILLWDVSAATANPALAAKPVPGSVETLWAALAGSDATEAQRAIGGLAATPDSAVQWLGDHLKAAAAIPADDVNQAIAGLDDPTFAKREAASKKLTEWEELAETAMRAALKTELSGEQRRRIEDILSAPRPVPKSEMLRQLRSVRVLERIAAPRAGATRLAAKDLLKKLAAGAPEARLTKEAKTSLERLEKQRKGEVKGDIQDK